MRYHHSTGHSESKVALIIESILGALAYAHDNGHVHGDIRPANIQCGAQDGFETLKLIGFAGLHNFTDRFGSANYIAPEVIGGAEVDTNNVGHTVKNVFIDLKAKKDLWSVGVLAYMLLSGHHPFKADTDAETYTLIKAGEPSYEGFSNISENGKAFCKALLNLDVTCRLTAEESLNHNWIRECTTKRAEDA